MKKPSSFQLCIALLLLGGSLPLDAGTISYGAIPGAASDPGSGISSQNTYTNAIDGGNDGADRVVNGVALHPLAAEGQTATADHCTVNSLTGRLTSNRPAENPAADGIMAEVLGDTTMNLEAGDDSQQEVILDPAGLQAGVTYDLRVYLRKADGQDRQINLAFAGDGQAPVETGFFSEDDATTSAGGFSAPEQAYYVNYRYTWDGDSIPGITVTQRKGSAPFNLYALTNQVVPAQIAALPVANQTLALTEVAPANDKIGVSSDLFYSDESLKRTGRWLEAGKYGTCWQPTGVPADWRPYTNGAWRHCDDAGWTWVTDEEWGWATYHYGRWFRSKKVGWCWVPGTVWAPSWVSWRQGQNEKCSCVGWAPLPPEAACDVNVGISRWVDRTSDIGPDAYSFVSVRDLGTDSYARCDCVYGRERNVTIINETVNITNIVYNNNITYTGGPDYGRCNDQIRQQGGREVQTVTLTRVDSSDALQGRHSSMEGNTLSLVSPQVTATKTPKHRPAVTEKIPAGETDKGWGQVRDPKVQTDLKNKIAQETKGATPKTLEAKLTPEQLDKVAKARDQKNAQNLGLTKTQHPGQMIKGTNGTTGTGTTAIGRIATGTTATGTIATGTTSKDTTTGKTITKKIDKDQPLVGGAKTGGTTATGTRSTGTTGTDTTATGITGNGTTGLLKKMDKDQHPVGGAKVGGTNGTANTLGRSGDKAAQKLAGGTTTNPVGTTAPHPGQSLKKVNAIGQTATGAHPGEKLTGGSPPSPSKTNGEPATIKAPHPVAKTDGASSTGVHVGHPANVGNPGNDSSKTGTAQTTTAATSPAGSSTGSKGPLTPPRPLPPKKGQSEAKHPTSAVGTEKVASTSAAQKTHHATPSTGTNSRANQGPAATHSTHHATASPATEHHTAQSTRHPAATSPPNRKSTKPAPPLKATTPPAPHPHAEAKPAAEPKKNKVKPTPTPH